MSFIDGENFFVLCVQQRFEEMESKINDLRDQIDSIKAEKIRLEKQIQVESEVLNSFNLMSLVVLNKNPSF